MGEDETGLGCFFGGHFWVCFKGHQKGVAHFEGRPRKGGKPSSVVSPLGFVLKGSQEELPPAHPHPALFFGGGSASYCGWTKSCTTLNPWEAIICWYLRGESSFRGFLGGAKWTSSTHSMRRTAFLGDTSPFFPGSGSFQKTSDPTKTGFGK